MSATTSVTDMPVATPAEAGSCVVCPHALGEHDRISLRFCQATQAAATTRGCVCPS